jgi:hypothetical protein
MKKLLFVVIVAVGIYLAWLRFGPSHAPLVGGNPKGTKPATNAAQRIDSLSGAAPDDH